MRPISLVIAHPDRMQRQQLMRSLSDSPFVEIVAETHDLMSTYAEVEERLPIAVLIAERLAVQPEFEVMRALFSTLDVRWLVFQARRPLDRPGDDGLAPWNRKSDLFAVDADTPIDRLIGDLRSLTRSARRNGQAPLAPAPEKTHAGRVEAMPKSDKFILIGASTGGVDALISVLSSFPQNCPPTFIVQHTGGGFGESLTRLLDRQCAARVRPARDDDMVRHGEIVVAAGTRAHLLLRGGTPLRCSLQASEPVAGHMPSVDVLFQSAVPGARRTVAALLTGMGRDGAQGLKALREAGATTIAQDEATSIVFGMPRAAMQIGAAQTVLPLPKIGDALIAACTPGQTAGTGKRSAR